MAYIYFTISLDTSPFACSDFFPPNIMLREVLSLWTNFHLAKIKYKFSFSTSHNPKNLTQNILTITSSVTIKCGKIIIFDKMW